MNEQEPATVERVTIVVAEWPRAISALRYFVEYDHVKYAINALGDLYREMCDLSRIIIESEDKLVKANRMQSCKAGKFSATTWHGLCLLVAQSFLGNIWTDIRYKYFIHEVNEEKNNETSLLKNFDAQVCGDHFEKVKSSILAFEEFDESGLSSSVRREGILVFPRSQDKNWGIEKPEPVPNSLIDANGGRQIAPYPDELPAGDSLRTVVETQPVVEAKTARPAKTKNPGGRKSVLGYPLHWVDEYKRNHPKATDANAIAMFNKYHPSLIHPTLKQIKNRRANEKAGKVKPHVPE